MRFWRKRKPAKQKQSPLRLERLEERAMMAVIPLASGSTAVFHDADGSEVKVKLTGPGSGTIELDGGVLTGAAIDTLSLAGTTGATRLKITARGGTVHGTTINDVVIDNAVGELDALKHFKGKHVTLTGDFTADGSIDQLQFRSLGSGATASISGDVGHFKAENLSSNAQLEVAATLRKFVAKLLESGSVVEANQLDMLKVKQQAVGATINVGTGGLGKAKFAWTYDSVLASEGNMGDVVFKHDAVGVMLATNIDKGSDGIYGTIDDFVMNPSLDGDIQSLKFHGRIGRPGTSQEIDVVSSGQVGSLKLGAAAQGSGGSPAMWLDAAQGAIPLSVIQAAAAATGFDEDEIWISIFGTETGSGSKAGNTYYIDPSYITDGVPILQQTNPATSASTPNLAILPSATLASWADASRPGGSKLAFRIPRNGNLWSGRILISVGAPVQAQINADGSVASPSASDTIDPSTGSFYDFLEFTVTGAATAATSLLDIDTSLVDEFGLPMALQLFQSSPTVGQFTGTLTPNSPTITGIANTAGLSAGQSILGANIPIGAVIQSITPSTSALPGSITLNVNVGPGGSGAQVLTAAQAFVAPLTGSIASGGNVITGINSAALQNAINNVQLGTGQPVVAPGVLPPGTTIESYVIGSGSDGSITLNQNAIASSTNSTFTVYTAGPVGVEALRDVITGTGAGSMWDFLQQQLIAGYEQARPFLASTSPFLLGGPSPISGAVPGVGAMVLTTAGASNLTTSDYVQISGSLNGTAANVVYNVGGATSTTLTLGHPISNGVYTSGGDWSIVSPSLVIGATSLPPVVTTTSTTGLANNDVVTVTTSGGAATQYVAQNVTSTTFALGGPIANGTYVTNTGYWSFASAPTTAIEQVTSGNNVVISTGNTAGLKNGDLVLISSVGGVSGVNGCFQVTGVTANSFQLVGASGTGTYTSGGNWQVVNAVTGAASPDSSSPIAVTTQQTPGLIDGMAVTVGGVGGNTAANGTFLVNNVSGTGFTLGSPAGATQFAGGTWNGGSGSGSVSSITPGAVVQITTPSDSGLANGDSVVVSGVAGNTGANGTYTVANVVNDGGTHTFTLTGSFGTGVYTSGGIVYQASAATQAITNVTGTGTDEITVHTASTPSLNNNDTVFISGVGGNTAANGLFLVDNVTANSFTLSAPIGNGSTNNNAWSIAIQNAETTSTVIVTGSTTGLAVGDSVSFAGVTGNTEINNKTFRVAGVNPTNFTLDGPIGNAAYTANTGFWSLPSATATPIIGASNAGPIVITTGNTFGLANDDWVTISGVGGNTAANGQFQIGSVTANSFTLVGSTWSGAYTDGGAWKKIQRVTGASFDGAPIEISTDNTAGVQIGGVVEVFDVGGNTAANGQFVVSAVTDNASFTLGSPAGGGATPGGTWTQGSGGSATGAVDQINTGGRVVITASTTAGLAEGDLIDVSGILGNTGANGTYTISAVSPTNFVLNGAVGTGNYTYGGTWKEYTPPTEPVPQTRLVSPKDLVESLSSPQDASSLNNYFNQTIDDFFLQYLPSSITLPNGQTGRNQTFSVTSTAFDGTSHTYSGTVTNTDTSNGGYVLRLTSSDASDPANYDIYYPFFTTNAPDAEIYTPAFPLAEPPTWIINQGQQFESASQMVFACDGVFADNVPRNAFGFPAQQSKVLADLENLISGAFNRGIVLNPATTWGDSTSWFPEGGTYNYWVEYWHQPNLAINDLAYAFAYDDKFGASTNLQVPGVGLAQIVLGQWSSTRTATSLTVGVGPSSSSTSPIAPNSSVTLTATMSDTTATGTVTFYVNGIPINANNDSNAAPLQLNTLTGGVATLTTELPDLPAGAHTYNVTAVYSGNGTYLPSIATTTVSISA